MKTISVTMNFEGSLLLSITAVAIARLHPSLYATARRDFAAFAPEALRLARADAGAVLEGGHRSQSASDTMMP
jgi:hypothetical protein